MKRRFLQIPTAWIICILLLFAAKSRAQEEVKAELPVLITSCGQSPGPMRLKVFMKRLNFDHVYNLQATAQDLTSAKEEGNPFKSIIIVTGASLKGMGAAGVSMDDELARIKALVEEAKKQGMTFIAAHVEGMSRRAQGAAPGDNSDELSIDAVCPNADIMLIRKDGDKDGRFTTLSEAGEIPILFFEKNMELANPLKLLFEK